jgi:hypothetical protein
MLLVAHVAAGALAASCPSSTANDLPTPPPAPSRQLITVEAPRSRTASATARICEYAESSLGTSDGG